MMQLLLLYLFTKSSNTGRCAHAGSGATAVVQVARCVKNDKKVAIKRIDLERCGCTIEELQVSHNRSRVCLNSTQVEAICTCTTPWYPYAHMHMYIHHEYYTLEYMYIVSPTCGHV